MRMKFLPVLGLSLVFLYAGGCSSNKTGTGDGGDGLDGLADGDGGGDLSGDVESDGGDLDGGGDQNPCNTANCPAWQHCELQGSSAVCVDNTCADLQCSATEECQPHPGGGAWCVDISCQDDLDCPEERYCSGGLCRDDVCPTGCLRCVDLTVQQCLPNGGGWQDQMLCGSDAYFESLCQEPAACTAFCTCQDDWDCPAWTQCEAGVCEGTGREPSCRLDPQPFANVLPVPEIVWGGTQADPTAPGSPFPEAVQVVMTPLVVNLDDDNGDGFVDERDFPEIVFMAFRQHDYTANGVLRAIHGGGPNKGNDFFAVCGDKVWHEGDQLDLYSCSYTEADLDSTTSLAAGDLDGDGRPEIVAVSENDNIHIYAANGAILSKNTAGSLGGADPAVSLANVDNQGHAEIVIGRNVFSLEKDGTGNLVVLDRFRGNLTHGTNNQGAISCVANLAGDGRMEIIAGTVAYGFPRPPAGVTRQSECTGAEVDPEEVAFCQGNLLVAWDAQVVNGSVSKREGFCAVADVLGVDPALPPGPANPLDGRPEVILIADGRLLVFDGETGVQYRDVDLQDGSLGGAPNVDDFDGDGFPEVGTAFLDRYIMYDFQPPTTNCPAWPGVQQEGQPPPAQNTPRQPGGACATDAECATDEAVCNVKIGQCICLHNGWMSGTEDDSSRVTGSSVFDFNGDGAAEVIYNDECRFRVYDGLNGEIWFSEPSESRTRVEYPVIADVDNDGNAEIVFCTTTESGFCSQNLDNQYNAGVEVWGDAGDFWVSARRIWNQHSYHVTNVFESGGIPTTEPESWRAYNGRIYNTYRSNPRSYDWAPDLTLTGMQFSSPDASCGSLSQLLDITLRVENIGDIRVGAALAISFEGTWDDIPVTEPLRDTLGDPLRLALPGPLGPGEVQILKASYDAASNGHGRLPDRIKAKVDADDSERECREDNNEITAPVEAGVQAADLRVELGAIQTAYCPDPIVETTIINEGSLPATGVVVRYFAGDPDQGGVQIGEITYPDTIGPGESATVPAQLFGFPARLVTLWAVVDPDDLVLECDEADNQTRGGQAFCPET